MRRGRSARHGEPSSEASRALPARLESSGRRELPGLKLPGLNCPGGAGCLKILESRLVCSASTRPVIRYGKRKEIEAHVSPLPNLVQECTAGRGPIGALDPPAHHQAN